MASTAARTMEEHGPSDLIQKMKYTLAEAVLTLENPSVAVLHQTVLEEFGERASPELVAYFEKKLQAKKAAAGALTQNVGESALDLARAVAAGESPSLEKFQKVFQEKRGEPPTAALTAFFKAELRKRGVKAVEEKAPPPPPRPVDGQTRVALLKRVAAGDDPTLEKLNQAFSKEFGIPVPPELVAVFNMEVQKQEAAKQGLTLAEYLVRQAKMKAAKPRP